MKKSRFVLQGKDQTCRLIAAMNAAAYFGRKVPTKRSAAFRQLRKETGCLDGSVIDMDPAWKRLGLKASEIPTAKVRTPNLLGFLRRGFLVEVTILDKERGLHSVLLMPPVVRPCRGGPGSVDATRVRACGVSRRRASTDVYIAWITERMPKKGLPVRRAWTISARRRP